MASKRQPGEGTYDKKGDYYLWSRRVGKRRYVVKRKDYTEFRQEVAKRQKEIALLRVSAPPKDATLGQFMPGWIEDFVAPPKKSRGTYRSYLGAYKNQIQPYLASQKLGRLRTAAIQAW